VADTEVYKDWQTIIVDSYKVLHLLQDRCITWLKKRESGNEQKSRREHLRS